MRERGRLTARSLGAALIGPAIVVGGLAVLLESGDPSQSLDPHHTGAFTAAGFAVVFCVVALWRLKEVARGRAGRLDAGLWYSLGVAGLLALLAVAFASNLGG